MKKVFSIICAAVIASTTAACGSTPTQSSSVVQGDASAVTSSSAASIASDAPKSTDSGTLGDYTVKIESARLSKDYEGKKVVVVKYKFTNNGDKAVPFMTAISGKAFQDGVELELAIVDSTKDKKFNSANSLKEIKKGASIEVEEGYLLSNNKSKVEVEATEFISLNETKLVKEFDVTKLK